ncbi:MAG: CPBP family intramembrane metalloprotease [Clostridia bacterium]|nr:CPBP family intramembrane metalloprotease [Clostridia bacterium]
MKKLKYIDVASLMMLVWFLFYVIAAFFAIKWAAFLAIIGCTAPMLLFKRSVRGETFGTRDCNTLRYKGKDYLNVFLFCISGSAVISAITYLVTAVGQIEPDTAARTDFPYMLVFGCLIPAFFEEWFVRGGILGALSSYKAAGVWISSIFFMLMHADPTKYIYAFFAGFCIGMLVYLTECVYLGMLLHFVNNFASLLLSYLPRGIFEYITLAIILVVFAVSFVLLSKSKIFEDAKEVFEEGKKQNSKDVLSPYFYIFVVLSFFAMSFRFI